MDFLFVALPILAAFVLGVWTGDDIKKALASRKKRLALVTPNPKPQNEFSDYTIEELEGHKKYREREYAQCVHYPALRQGHAEALKKVIEMLDYHYTISGEFDFRAQRDANRRDLKNFDEMYAAALKGSS